MNRRSRVNFCSIAVVLVAGASVSLPTSAQAAENTPPSFEEADADHDDLIDIEEARHIFSDLVFEDADNDGILSKREAEQALPGLVYTRDTHEDAEEQIGLGDYLQMAEFYLTRRLVPLSPVVEN